MVDTTVYTSGLEIKITNVQLAHEDLNKLDARHFPNNPVRVDFIIENTSDKSIDVNSHIFEMYDGDRTLSERQAKNYFSNEIAAGMKAEGSVYFDVKNLGKLTIKVGAGMWYAKIN
ncbi:DUF4352 domain-containing protein [Aerococcaceae bacterium zg-B36]|uniref:DUF4352 domain-containing protein n=1 Tax=Aerococcaceae bacterium zg-252 TaxID=2796928 RepID=UPI001BD8BD4F|nr:DUF4352 domain-containing protein [Aerococcaceae bacterium zg-B36]